MKKESKLQDGFDFQGYERQIIGNEQGLLNLIEACKKAIDSGSCQSKNLDNYQGVTKVDDTFFEEKESSNSLVITTIFIAVVLSMASVFLIGIVTIWQWF